MNSEWFENISSADQAAFSRIVALLLSANYLPRWDYDSEGKRTESADWRFAKKNLAHIQDYLGVMSLDCSYDEILEVVYVTCKADGPKFLKEKPDKVTTDMIYTLRLLYEEFHEKNILEKDAIVDLPTLIRRICDSYNISPKAMPKDRIKKSLVMLERHRIIKLTSGSLATFDDAKFVIFPSIILVIPEERLVELARLIEKRQKDAAYDEFQAEDGDEDEDDDEDDNIDEILE